MAYRACELTHWKRAGYLESLAAAYAEASDFPAAIKYQTQARADPGYEQRHGG